MMMMMMMMAVLGRHFFYTYRYLDLIFPDKKEKEARPVLSSLLQHCSPHRTLSIISRLSWREDVQILLVLMQCGAHKQIK